MVNRLILLTGVVLAACSAGDSSTADTTPATTATSTTVELEQTTLPPTTTEAAPSHPSQMEFADDLAASLVVAPPTVEPGDELTVELSCGSATEAVFLLESSATEPLTELRRMSPLGEADSKFRTVLDLRSAVPPQAVTVRAYCRWDGIRFNPSVTQQIEITDWRDGPPFEQSEPVSIARRTLETGDTVVEAVCPNGDDLATPLILMVAAHPDLLVSDFFDGGPLRAGTVTLGAFEPAVEVTGDGSALLTVPGSEFESIVPPDASPDNPPLILAACASRGGDPGGISADQVFLSAFG